MKTTDKLNVLNEVCYNDLTNLYRHEEYGQYPVTSYELENIKPKTIYYHSPFLSFGDYDNSCQVERSNVRIFKEMFPNHKDVKYFRGAYGYEAICIDVLCEDQQIIETLNSLLNYPAINNEDCSLMEMEMEESDFNSWIEMDLRSAIIKKYNLCDIWIESDELFQYYNELKEQTNLYYEVQPGGAGWIDIERLIADLPENCPEKLKPVFYE